MLVQGGQWYRAFPSVRLPCVNLLKTTDKSFKIMSFQYSLKVDIGGQECLAIRISYTGELGWEIYMPMQGMKAVYKALLQKGRIFNAVAVFVEHQRPAC